jgi:hypothetical protein
MRGLWSLQGGEKGRGKEEEGSVAMVCREGFFRGERTERISVQRRFF